MSFAPHSCRRLLLLIAISGLFWPCLGQTKLLQIIHTNDIHALFETVDGESGGLAQIKYVIDQLKAKAEAAGIETLVTDGGDFADGTIFRYSESGAGPLRALDSIGYDAAVIGNHDWLVGASQLNDYFKQVRPKTPFVTANFKIKKKHQALKEHFRPYASMTKAGAKIAVLGLTTNEFIYDWLVVAGRMTSASKAARKWVPKLKRKHDFVIVLSHMGFKKDKKVAEQIRGVDLVIGAHSHTELQKPAYARNPSGFQVPIVQAGAHGRFVGDLLVDLEPGFPVRVIRNNLIEVKTNGPKNEQVASLVEDLRNQLELQYGPGWLSEVLMDSPVPMEPPTKQSTPWGVVYAEALKEASGAEVSMDFSMFFGLPQSSGPITREKLFNYYPRTFSTLQPRGWTIWKVKMPGWLLKTVIQLTGKFGGYANTAGITYKTKQDGKSKKLSKFRVNGKRLNPVKIYTVAMSEGVGRGTDDISKFLRSFFLPRDTGIPIWVAVEEKLRQTHPQRGLSSLP